ncbi:MAG TPA: PQQ-dependent sugar dehydrogenase, partial [Elusimicrobiota bacterium]|nr:PQQ-dependent sugar dehydrogenase [Elusimicrobiota bacterium]
MPPSLLAAALVAGLACARTPVPEVSLEPALGGRRFQKPLFAAWPRGDGRAFVVEQGGRVWAAGEDGKASLFLDLSDATRAEGEKGLLGLAFHPRFRENGYFYVYYSGRRRADVREDHCSVLARFHAPRAGPAERASESVVLRVSEPYPNHNGGGILFGPDGYLYIGLGDGGGHGDPRGNGQRLDALLGKMLRVDVDASGAAYSVPKDNPFVGRAGARGEIWAWGLRNPWRFSFDRETGTLWAGDVGQDEVEEIDALERGGNYGWSLFEGSARYKGGPAAEPAGFQKPAAQYRHGAAGACVVGGYVYRGRRF